MEGQCGVPDSDYDNTHNHSEPDEYGYSSYLSDFKRFQCLVCVFVVCVWCDCLVCVCVCVGTHPAALFWGYKKTAV